MQLPNIKAISGLALIFEKKELLQSQHLIIASLKDLEKLKSFLHVKPPKIPWYDLPPFPKPKSPYSQTNCFKRIKWQTLASDPESPGSLFLASPQALLKKTHIRSVPIIKKGEDFPLSVLQAYQQKPLVEGEGEFSDRGYLRDLFSPAYDSPLRLTLFKNKIESIHLLDKSFKKRSQELDKAFIPCPYEWSKAGEDRKKLLNYLREEEKQLKLSLPVEFFKSFSRAESYYGFEHLLNCLNTTCSLDCFVKAPTIWFFKPQKAKELFLEEMSELENEQAFFKPHNLFIDWSRLESEFKPTAKKEKLVKNKQLAESKKPAKSEKLTKSEQLAKSENPVKSEQVAESEKPVKSEQLTKSEQVAESEIFKKSDLGIIKGVFTNLKEDLKEDLKSFSVLCV